MGPRERSAPTGAGVSHPLCPVRPPATHRPRPDAPTRAHRAALAQQAASPSPYPAPLRRGLLRARPSTSPGCRTATPTRRSRTAGPRAPAPVGRPGAGGAYRRGSRYGLPSGRSCVLPSRSCVRGGRCVPPPGPGGRRGPAERLHGLAGGGTSGRALVRTARRFCGRPGRRCGRPDNLVRRANAPGPGQLKPSASATPPDGPPHKARGPTMRPVPAATLTYPSWSGTCPRFTDIRRTHHTQERFADGHSESAAQRFRSLQGDP